MGRRRRDATDDDMTTTRRPEGAAITVEDRRMGRRSRDKGAAYEREKVRDLNEVLGREAASRSMQAGKGGICGTDVDCPPFGHEVKWIRSPNNGITATLEQLAQEVADSRLKRIPVFVWKLAVRDRLMVFKERVILQWRHYLLMLWALEKSGGMDLVRKCVEAGDYEPWKREERDGGGAEDS